MAYNEHLANRVRELLMNTDLPIKVEEKNMFQGLVFMVNDKMCIGVRDNEIMCRVGPEMYEELVERTECRPMMRGKSTIRGYLFVSMERLKKKEDMKYWVRLCLEFNKKAKASKKKKSSNSTYQ